MSVALKRYLADEYSPRQVAGRCGVDAATIERIALEMAHVAFNEAIELPIRWTDVYGRTHDKVVGRPVAMYAMRGVSAHANGFQSCRALHLLQMLLGVLEGPGNFRARAPYPRPIPPPQLPENDARAIDTPDAPLTRPPLGFPTRPEDLAIDKDGKPLRIDKAFSWEAPLAAHGAMHRVIANAVAGDPYRIDTLMLYMANMAWNSSMDTGAVQRMLKEKDASGEYKIPFLVVADAFHSETVNFADLVLPDTTYLERYDAISLLDRPISEPDAAADAIRHPVLPLDRDVRPFQDVLVELATRLGFPAFVTPEGARKYRDYPDFIVKYERAPGVGFLAGFRGANGDQPLRGEPNPRQWDAYIANGAFFTHHWNDSQKYYRFVNRDYQEAALKAGFILRVEPIVLQIYSEPLQKFRNTGKVDPKAFDPLPTWYEVTDPSYPFVAITQRPMMMYHSWDSQNAWLRQLLSQNFIYMNEGRAAELGFADLEEVWVESRLGRIRARLKTMQGLEAGTVWTWNAVAKQAGAWGLSSTASEVKESFLLNHLIPESSDPITGQAAWFDLGVKITRCD
jgi:anaerobic selenocysteine-containing dehydrogenase